MRQLQLNCFLWYRFSTNRLIIYALLFSSLFLLLNCEDKELAAQGPREYEERPGLTNFTKVDLNISATIYILQADSYHVEIEAQESVLDVLKTEVNNSILTIDLDKPVLKHEDINVYLTMPVVKHLQINDLGVIRIKNLLNTENIDLDISGAGEIRIDSLNAKQIVTEIGGVGTVSLAGKEQAGKHTITIKGTGDINAADLPTETVDVEVRGNGDCYVHATKKLIVKIIGTGNVYYTGHPMIESKILGSGDLYDNNLTSCSEQQTGNIRIR